MPGAVRFANYTRPSTLEHLQRRLWMAVLSELPGAVCDAEKRSRTAEQAPMFEHMEVRVRRGRCSASIAGVRQRA